MENASNRQPASTRVWVPAATIGVPVGMHTDVPASMATGAPPAITRVAPESQRPAEQGGLGVPASAQFVTAYVVERVTSGWPETNTR
ncbi:MAG: hypothetical protein QOF41_3490 [Methylobacteriaceae bacterium]|nr:hypothetical protein [Methylobacteriaceae bacterium]